MTAGTVRCAAAHTFDIAREGYVTLLRGPGTSVTGDRPDMVAARGRFLDAGHFAPVERALVDCAAAALNDAPDGLVVDAGAGTGRYLAAVLERCPDRHGLALDLSRAAARRAVRGHERIGAVVCDIWQPLPVRDGAAALVLNVFAPRNAAEFRRMLRPGGHLVVITPRPGHLAELVQSLGLLHVARNKDEQTGEALAGHFTLSERREVTAVLSLTADDATAVAMMGPSAWHTDPKAMAFRVAGMPWPARVTASVALSVYRRR